MTRPWLVVSAALLMWTAAGASEDWPQFRGPSAGVVADDPALPETWNKTQNVVWTADVPGLGWSSPVVWGDQIFVTTVISSGAATPPQKGLFAGTMPYDAKVPHRWMVYAMDFGTGRVRWQREVRNIVPPTPKHIKNSFASETPATDGERVLRLLCRHRAVRLRHAGEPCVGERDGANGAGIRVRLGCLPGGSQESRVHRQR